MRDIFRHLLRTRDKPLLLIDIDGVLSLWGFDRTAAPAGTWCVVDGVVHFLSGAAARHLHVLAECFEPAWCSGWEEKANQYLPHALGVGPYPLVSFDANPGEPGAHWKLRGIDTHAASRPLAWVDDAHDERCHAWAAARPAPTLLVATDPATGLTQRETARLLRWAEGVGR